MYEELSEFRRLLETPRLKYALKRRPLLATLINLEVRKWAEGEEVHDLVRLAAELEEVADDFGPEGPAGAVVGAMMRSSGALLNSVEHYLGLHEANPDPDLRGLAMAYERAQKITKAAADAYPDVWQASYEDLACLAETCAALDTMDVGELVVSRRPDNVFRVTLEPLGPRSLRESKTVGITGEHHGFVAALAAAVRVAAEKWGYRDGDE